MYESPINILKGETLNEIDKSIFKVIQKIDVNVNEEVIKALKYDRDQYAKGYNDAIDDAINAINNYNASEECDFYEQFGCMICISILKDLEKEVKDAE